MPSAERGLVHGPDLPAGARGDQALRRTSPELPSSHRYELAVTLGDPNHILAVDEASGSRPKAPVHAAVHRALVAHREERRSIEDHVVHGVQSIHVRVTRPDEAIGAGVDVPTTIRAGVQPLAEGHRREGRNEGGVRNLRDELRPNHAIVALEQNTLLRGGDELAVQKGNVMEGLGGGFGTLSHPSIQRIGDRRLPVKRGAGYERKGGCDPKKAAVRRSEGGFHGCPITWISARWQAKTPPKRYENATFARRVSLKTGGTAH